MEEKRMVVIGVGAVLVIMTTSLLAVTLTSEEEDGGGGTDPPQLNKTNPLLLISLDGFRSDYLFRSLPTLETLAKTGVWARYMMPSYPTLTFPNHYSIVTGMYPAAHGIVANSFYDSDFGANFSMGVKDGKWWGGEPIWNTLTLQNKTSATFFWPGSDCNISGLYPTNYYDFDKSIPFETRVNQVLEWLSQPEDERPDFVSLYFEEPDSAGHKLGPESFLLDNELSVVDGLISRLLQGLRSNQLEDKVNIIVLADHGMAQTAKEKHLNLTNYVNDILDRSAHNYYGPFTTLKLKDSSTVSVENMVKKLSCPAGAPAMRAYTPPNLPKRFHYANNKRIGDIVLDLDSGYFTYDYDNPFYFNNPFLGNHGYDNYLSTMSALFIASGPDFKKNMTLEPFQNIELYNLMCYLTGVDPAPNNGTEGALYNALLVPPFLPDLPVETHPPTPQFPDQSEVNKNSTLQMAQCPGDLQENDNTSWLLDMNFNKSEQNRLEELHLPWGIPLSGNRSTNLLLHHEDHVTWYAEDLRMPLWTSFTVTQPQGSQENKNLWSSDVRLNITNTPSCASYDNLTDVVMFPLFYPVFSINSESRVPYLVSNAVPLVVTSKIEEAVFLLADRWIKKIEPINVVFGVAFDDDADSFPDDTTNATYPAVPSHIFIVVTSCRQLISSLDKCKEEDLDALAFIIPQFQTANNNCLTPVQYVAFHLATVRDVELLTGFTFFPDLDPESRLQLALRIHTHI